MIGYTFLVILAWLACCVFFGRRTAHREEMLLAAMVCMGAWKPRLPRSVEQDPDAAISRCVLMVYPTTKEL